MKQFLKVEGLQLVNGGYLSNQDGKPVSNKEFVAAQLEAHYVCTFAALAKGKDFEGKKADSLDDVKAAVQKALGEQKTTFVAAPANPKRTINDKLAAEAMAFVEFTDSSEKTEKINDFLQKFTVLNDFEVNGLFFDEDIVKLPKIYSLKEVVDAVTSTIDLI